MSFPDYRLFVSPQAQQDIASILRYTGKTWRRNRLASRPQATLVRYAND